MSSVFISFRIFEIFSDCTYTIATARPTTLKCVHCTAILDMRDLSVQLLVQLQIKLVSRIQVTFIFCFTVCLYSEFSKCNKFSMVGAIGVPGEDVNSHTVMVCFFYPGQLLWGFDSFILMAWSLKLFSFLFYRGKLCFFTSLPQTEASVPLVCSKGTKTPPLSDSFLLSSYHKWLETPLYSKLSALVPAFSPAGHQSVASRCSPLSARPWTHFQYDESSPAERSSALCFHFSFSEISELHSAWNQTGCEFVSGLLFCGVFSPFTVSRWYVTFCLVIASTK